MQRLTKIGVGVGVGVAALVAVIVIVVVATSGGGDTDAFDKDGPWNNIRLPANILAERYDMQLDINWENMTYSGIQEVTMTVTAETKYFLIHTRGLTLDKTKTKLFNNGTELTVKRSFMDTEAVAELKHDFYVVESEKVVGAGQYKMSIPFAGSVNTARLTGMYRSAYDRGDKKIYQISTDFEPVDARSAFPCFDEPAQKAIWETTITVTFPATIDTAEYNIVSNMPLKDDGETKTATTVSAAFKESVPMSTYLVCFAVSDFASTTGTYTRADGTTVALRVMTRREQTFVDSAAYAIKVTPLILKKYEDFYKVNYPLPKLDQIALPEFNSGAMENWGLIIYRESSLLFNAVTSSKNEKQRVCAVIAHEIAHQWFGNIVTMAWWNDLWLNEGFASFVEYYGIDAAEPDWKILDFFYPDEMTTAMNFDSSPSSHPISVSVESPEELSGLFDTISYRKGASINWMMQKFMGEDAFKAGLAAYIKEFQWGNAAMVDLFDALQTANTDDSVNVTEVMLTWTMQMGFPYVDVVLETAKDENVTKIKLTQARFLKGDALPDDISEYGYKWHIPFTYMKEGMAESAVTWLKPNQAETVVEEAGVVTWVKGNAKGNYYYITNYEASVWGELSRQLTAGNITSATDKTSLFYDAFSLAKIGKVQYSTALDLTLYAVNETEYVVLSRVLSGVLFAGNSIEEDETATAKYWAYVTAMLKPRVDEVGWTVKVDESFTTPKLRDMVIRNYCKGVHNATNPVVLEALEKFDTFAADPSQANKAAIADVFVSVMRTAIIYDDENNSRWEVMSTLLQASDWEADQKIYIAALARTSNETLLRKMVTESFKEGVKAGCWRYLYYVHYQGKNYDLGWELLKENWDVYAEKYNTTSFTMGYLTEMPDVFNTQEKYDEVKAFFDSIADNIGTGLKASIEALTKIKSNIKWRANNAETVKSWFNALP